jgi:excinuclease ABC subunit B
MAEDLTDYLQDVGIRVPTHADVETIRAARDHPRLRRGRSTVLVGINLLREGLDLPETIAGSILTRKEKATCAPSVRSIQTIGRAARNVNGTGAHVRRR